LKHLYFALEGLRDRFVYLHYGLAAILVFIGVKSLLEGFGVHLPIIASLLPIAAILAISIGVSWFATGCGRSGGGDGKPEDGGNQRRLREASGGAAS
jgi:tellurite resistance protein TerC